MGTDDCSIEQLIAWHKAQAGKMMQAHLKAALVPEASRSFFAEFERFEATAELLIELAERRDADETEDE